MSLGGLFQLEGEAETSYRFYTSMTSFQAEENAFELQQEFLQKHNIPTALIQEITETKKYPIPCNTRNIFSASASMDIHLCAAMNSANPETKAFLYIYQHPDQDFTIPQLGYLRYPMMTYIPVEDETMQWYMGVYGLEYSRVRTESVKVKDVFKYPIMEM